MSKWFGPSSGQSCANHSGGAARRPGSQYCDDCLAEYPAGEQCGTCGRVLGEGEKRISARHKVVCVTCSSVKVRR
jgi:hypothetical protein